MILAEEEGKRVEEGSGGGKGKLARNTGEPALGCSHERLTCSGDVENTSE